MSIEYCQTINIFPIQKSTLIDMVDCHNCILHINRISENSLLAVTVGHNRASNCIGKQNKTAEVIKTVKQYKVIN